eukprot:15442511-Alexandrium_andersonii.AAC.1
MQLLRFSTCAVALLLLADWKCSVDGVSSTCGAARVWEGAGQRAVQKGPPLACTGLRAQACAGRTSSVSESA